MISEKAVIHPNVKMGKNCIVEDYAIIGASVRGEEKHPETVIGDNAIIRSHSVIYAGNRIGSGFQTGNKANIREFNTIGDDVSIGTLSVVEHHVEIGDGVRIHSQAFIPEFSVLEKDCWIGPNVVITNARYPSTPVTKDNLEGVQVGENAKIGANTTVLPGVIVGRSALIGAGSVVTKDILENRIVVGNPAAPVGWACDCGIPLDEDLKCKQCGRGYHWDSVSLERI